MNNYMSLIQHLWQNRTNPFASKAQPRKPTKPLKPNIIETKIVDFDPTKSILAHYEEHKKTLDRAAANHATLQMNAQTNRNKMQISKIEFKNAGNKPLTAAFVETMVEGVATSTLVDLPIHFSSKQTWEKICDSLADDTRAEFGIHPQLTNAEFKRLFELLQKKLHSKPTTDIKEHILAIFKEQRLDQGAIQHPKKTAAHLANAYNETLTKRNQYPQKFQGYDFPGKRLLELVAAQLSNLTALKPNEPIYLNNAPSVEYARAIMLYAKATGTTLINRTTPHINIDPDAKELNAFQAFLDRQGIALGNTPEPTPSETPTPA